MRNRKNKRSGFRKAFGLIESLVAITILLAAVVGGLWYQYFATLDANKADMHIASHRIGLLLLEGWKAEEAQTDYDPVVLFGSEMDIANSTAGEPGAQLSELLGSYVVEDDGVNYYITLSYADVASMPRVINVSVAWNHKGGNSDYSEVDSETSITSFASY